MNLDDAVMRAWRDSLIFGTGKIRIAAESLEAVRAMYPKTETPTWRRLPRNQRKAFDRKLRTR